MPIETAELALTQAPPRVTPDHVELVFGLPSYASGDEGRELLSRIREATTLLHSDAVLVVPQALDALSSAGYPTVALASIATESTAAVWLQPFEQMRAVSRAAIGLGAKNCIILGPDAHQLSGSAIAAFADPLLRDECDLVMPRYPLRPQEGLMNRSILYPLTRVLYGKRVHFPLTMDAGLSASMMRVIIEPASSKSSAASFSWMGIESVLAGTRVCEVPLAVNHQPRTEGADLATLLASVVGPLFHQMETHAAVWQRSRSSVEVPQREGPRLPDAQHDAIETQRMLESFLLGWRNLHQIWSLVLPPVTLFQLNKLARLPAEQFRMPDALWARIVYDFALAHRLRTINLSHLFGAFTPLYLGWAASYAMEIGATTSALADTRTEALAAAFEADKTYLLSRWRWPDRFNP